MTMTISDLGRFAALDTMQPARSLGVPRPARALAALAPRGARSSSLPIRLALPFPPAGAGAIVWFDNEALETLRETLGADYLAQIDAGLAEHSPSMIRMLLDASLRNADVDAGDLVDLLPLADIATVLIDALALRVYGKRASTKSAEDTFIERARATKVFLDAAGTEGHEIALNADGSATIPKPIVAVVAFLIAAMDDL